VSTNDRRTFLRHAVAAGFLTAAVGLPQLSRLLPTSTRSERVPASSRSVWTWLRMSPVEGQGAIFDVPTSESAYVGNLERIDVAMPANGGKLQADGTWLQELHKIEDRWPAQLPRIAREARHLYIPIVGNDRKGVFDVLADRTLQRRAARELVALATRRRADAPWDGVLLDLEAIPQTYRAPLSAFYRLLGSHLRAAGLGVGISVGGRVVDDGADDFSVIAEVADFVDLRCYGYREPQPRSISPLWWVDGCLEFAQTRGVTEPQLVLGLGTFCKYWPDSSVNYPVAEITHSAAMRLLAEAGATAEWIASNEHGAVGELFGDLGRGHVWIHDEATHQSALGLADRHNVADISLFSPGMGERHWPTTQAWRGDAAPLSSALRPPYTTVGET